MKFPEFVAPSIVYDWLPMANGAGKGLYPPGAVDEQEDKSKRSLGTDIKPTQFRSCRVKMTFVVAATKSFVDRESYVSYRYSAKDLATSTFR
jgi:hypothetical protein